MIKKLTKTRRNKNTENCRVFTRNIKLMEFKTFLIIKNVFIDMILLK